MRLLPGYFAEIAGPQVCSNKILKDRNFVAKSLDRLRPRVLIPVVYDPSHIRQMAKQTRATLPQRGWFLAKWWSKSAASARARP